MKRLTFFCIWGVAFFFAHRASCQLNDAVRLNEFPWSRMVTITNDVVSVRSKPVEGYVVLQDKSIHFGKLRLKKVNGELGEVQLKARKWKTYDLSEVIGLGRITSPVQLNHQGRNLYKDTTQNFYPVRFDHSGTERKGYICSGRLFDGGRVLLFAESLEDNVEIIHESEIGKLTYLQEGDAIRSLYELEANKAVKYGILVGNSVQMAFDGILREGLRIRALKHSYETPDHHLFEASRATYKGNYGYASFMLGTGAYGYLVPSDEEEVEIPAEVVFGGVSYGPFLHRLFQAIDTSDYEPADQWTLADYLNTYALFLHNKGKHRVARSLYEYGLSVCQHHLPENAEIALALQHNYALNLFEAGHYREADSLLNDVTKKISRYKGPEHPVFLVLQNNRSMLSARMGAHQDAIAVLGSLREKADRIIPDYSVDDLRFDINLALLEHYAGHYDRAMSLYIEVIEQLKRREKVSLHDYSLTMLLLGNLYLDYLENDAGNADRLSSFLSGVKETVENEYSRKHNTYANILLLEGRYHLLGGRYKEALDDFQAANEIFAKNKGIKSYDYLSSSRLVALCLWKTGSLRKAEARLRALAESYLELKSELFSTMSEVQREAFWQQIKPQIDLYTYFAIENAGLHPEWLIPAFNFRIQTKGLLYSSSAQLRRSVNESNDPELQNLFKEWIALREELLVQYNLDYDDRDKTSFNEEELKAGLEKVERSLAASISVPDTITFTGLQEQLAPNEAIVEIIKIDKHPGYLDSVRYNALVINSNSEMPQVVDLGVGELLERKFYNQYINNINYQLEDNDSFKILWSDIRDQLNGAKRVYMVNDGVYNLINIEGLRNGEDEYLTDNLEVVYLTDLNWEKAPVKGLPSRKATLIGGPLFGTQEISLLPGALTEVDTLSRLLESDGFSLSVYTKHLATEENLRSINDNAGILHVATHGYFLDQQVRKTPLNTLAGRPDLQSGLILAEAKSERPDFLELYDGFFSSYEALNLNLSDIDLVVLSACETGKGNLIAGESVQGLARAFKIAGADHLIMSLWKVDDAATQRLMSSFYQKWIRVGDFHEAFRQAKKELRKQYPHPYYWSGFVLLE